MTCKICNKEFIPSDTIARVVVGKILDPFDETIEYDSNDLSFDAHWTCLDNMMNGQIAYQEKDECKSIERTDILCFMN